MAARRRAIRFLLVWKEVPDETILDTQGKMHCKAFEKRSWVQEHYREPGPRFITQGYCR